MKPTTYLKAVVAEAAANGPYRRPSAPGDGWETANDLCHPLRVVYVASVHMRLRALVALGLAEKRKEPKCVYYRLARGVRSWPEAVDRGRALHADPIPKGYAPLSAIAEKLGKTQRALAYFVESREIPFKVFRSWSRDIRYYDVKTVLRARRRKDP
jgi:hypothetical protein